MLSEIDWSLSVDKLPFKNLASVTPVGVRRAKAALFQWVKVPPG